MRGADLAHESLAVRKVQVERSRRGLEGLRRAADDDGDAAAVLRQDRVERLAVRGADAQPEPELAKKRDAKVCAESDLCRNCQRRRVENLYNILLPGGRERQENYC